MGDEPDKFYAVAKGRRPGVYTNWETASEAIKGTKGPKYKRFGTRAEAEAFIRLYGNAETVLAMEGVGLDDDDDDDDEDEESEADDDDDEEEEEEEEEEELHVAKKIKTGATTSVSASSTGQLLRIYTDGSSRNNGYYGAAAGVGVFFGPNDPRLVCFLGGLLRPVLSLSHQVWRGRTTLPVFLPPFHKHTFHLADLVNDPNRNISERLQGEPQTNQRAELTAVLRALETVPVRQGVQIVTDSKYSIQCVTEWYSNWEKNGWMTRQGPVKNRDLVQAIRAKIGEREARGTQSVFTWVKGHATDPGNIAADNLAVQGSRAR